MIAKKDIRLPPPRASQSPEIAAAPTTSARVLGIDFGEKRIGLAISDAEARWAMPLTTLERQTDRRAIYQIADLARQEGVGRLILGEPLGLDGEVGEAALRVRRFGKKLARVTGLPLHFVDEALTTVEATERLRAVGLDHRNRPQRRDEVAAQILLQEALDRETVSREPKDRRRKGQERNGQEQDRPEQNDQERT